MFWKELGLSGGAAVVMLVVLYFVIKWAVQSAIDNSRDEIARAVQKGIEQYEQEKMAEKGMQPPPDTEEDT